MALCYVHLACLSFAEINIDLALSWDGTAAYFLMASQDLNLPFDAAGFLVSDGPVTAAARAVFWVVPR